MTLQPYRFIPPCHHLSFSQVHQMVSSPFQIQQKQTRTKRCYTSVRGALASPRQFGANASSYGVWAASDMETFSLWSDEVCHLVWDQFTIWFSQAQPVAVIRPSVHTQSRTWVTDYLIACLPLQEGLRLYVGSNEYALPFIGISLTFPRGDAAFITPPRLSSSNKVDW